MKSSIGLFYQLTVRDKNGMVIRKTRLRRSESFVLAFLQLLQAHMTAENVTIKDVEGSGISVPQHAYNFDCASDLGSTFRGILLGTGTTSPANNDHVMETLIAHGSGATELNYAATSFVVAQEVGANVDFQILRSMQNLSGNTINVTEAGIVGRLETTKFALLVHDVFSAVPVKDGETITATYTFRTKV